MVDIFYFSGNRMNRLNCNYLIKPASWNNLIYNCTFLHKYTDADQGSGVLDGEEKNPVVDN